MMPKILLRNLNSLLVQVLTAQIITVLFGASTPDRRLWQVIAQVGVNLTPSLPYFCSCACRHVIRQGNISINYRDWFSSKAQILR